MPSPPNPRMPRALEAWQRDPNMTLATVRARFGNGVAGKLTRECERAGIETPAQRAARKSAEASATARGLCLVRL